MMTLQKKKWVRVVAMATTVAAGLATSKVIAECCSEESVVACSHSCVSAPVVGSFSECSDTGPALAYSACFTLEYAPCNGGCFAVCNPCLSGTEPQLCDECWICQEACTETLADCVAVSAPVCAGAIDNCLEECQEDHCLSDPPSPTLFVNQFDAGITIDGSECNPFRIVRQAQIFANPMIFTTVRVFTGHYTESVTIDKPMQLVPYGGGPVTIGL
jgi:hypothetical protein